MNHPIAQLLDWTETFIPKECEDDPNTRHHARLIVNFGLVGGIFGFIFTCFYAVLEHHWGAGIVFTCTIGLLCIGFGRFKNLSVSGNLVATILILGFMGLAFTEGGINGHAVSWLATIPVTALVLNNTRSGLIWLIIALLATIFFSQYYLTGQTIPYLYPQRWHTLITTVGYISLTLFTGILGLVIENGRKTAFARMQAALDRLSEANHQLTLLNQEKTDILQVVAHDLRSPLQAILGHASLISEGFLIDPIQIQSSGGQIVKTSRRMASLIDNLLDLNALEEGRRTYQLDKINLAAIVSDCILHHTFTAQNKDILLAWERPLAPVEVLAASQPVTQILDNFLSNAVKYSPKNTTVTLSLEIHDNLAQVSVQDQGPGLGEADQARLFQKFTRLSSKPTGGESSSGLGLSIAKKMTESMGGTVGCRSILGEGCVFYFTLPLHPPDILQA